MTKRTAVTNILAARVANGGVHGMVDTAELPMPTIGVLNGNQHHYSESESDNEALAAGLERELAEYDSPASLSEVDDPSESDASFDQSEPDDDDDFVPQTSHKKAPRPRAVPAYENSDSDEPGAPKSRRSISAVKSMFSNSSVLL